MRYTALSSRSGFNKKEFSCGKDLLDNYIHKQAGQDLKRRLSAIFRNGG
jgi:hypothetical protein